MRSAQINGSHNESRSNGGVHGAPAPGIKVDKRFIDIINELLWKPASLIYLQITEGSIKKKKKELLSRSAACKYTLLFKNGK